MYKDEQLREAQAWIASVREAGVFPSTSNQTLQAELRERTEQYNHLWMAFQRQVDWLFPLSPLILYFYCTYLITLLVFFFSSELLAGIVCVYGLGLMIHCVFLSKTNYGVSSLHCCIDNTIHFLFFIGYMASYLFDHY